MWMCASAAQQREKEKSDGKTHILASLQIIFLQKIPTVSQRQNSSSPSNSQSTAWGCVVLCSLDQRVWSHLDPGVALDWYDVPLRSFAASCWRNRRKLVSQRVLFFFFFHIFQKLCSQYIAKGLGFVRPICIQAVLLGCARIRALPVH